MVFILEDSDIEALQRGDIIHLETEDGTIYGLITRKFIEDTKEDNNQ